MNITFKTTSGKLITLDHRLVARIYHLSDTMVVSLYDGTEYETYNVSFDTATK